MMRQLIIMSIGVAITGKSALTIDCIGHPAKVKILALVSPYSEKPNVRYASHFNLGSFT